MPTILVLNPRSIYNKIQNFETYVKEQDIDVVCLSESWEKPEHTLDKIISTDKYEVISNVHQRKKPGGRPAIIVRKGKFIVENLTNTEVVIPWGVEAIWIVISLKSVTNSSLIKKIVVASIYSKPGSKKKTLLLDHIAQTYHALSAKYKDGLAWCICGDFNDTKTDSILHLNSKLKQVVNQPTRLNPPAILDQIITDLYFHYQTPVIDRPLEVDDDKIGSDSDHFMVKFLPLTNINNHVIPVKKKIEYRPLTDQGYKIMEQVLENFDWEVIENDDAEKQIETFQDTLFSIFEDSFPLKTRIISSRNEPFFTDELQRLRKKKCKEFNKHRKSSKYISLENIYKKKLLKAKKTFYNQKVQHLKSANPRQWYRQLKKIMKYDEAEEKIEVDSIKHLSDHDQAEQISNNFAQISNEYDPLDRSAIDIPEFSNEEMPVISESDVREAMENLKTNKAERKSDVPAKIFKHFSKYLSKPIAILISKAIRQGCWPKFLKIEIVTPIPKVSSVKDIDDLRKITSLMTLDKLMERIISKMIISDMKSKLDPAQFANQKGLSIQHYLIKMIDKILLSCDSNAKGESVAVLATMVDWRKAFDRQCPTLGIKSFIKNNVRPSLIPILMNYFEDRKMQVKWHGVLSEIRNLNGGGPQGSSFGILEYLSQSNDNSENVPVDERFKFIDDLTVLEIISLLNVGLASHNPKVNVPNDININNQMIPPEHLKTQKYVNDIDEWTKKNKMMLNPKKTKNIIFNFSKQYQFTTDIILQDEKIETVKETKLLGTIITEDLKWSQNTEFLVKKANQRMRMLQIASKFTTRYSDLKTIYKLFIRSILEQSAVVWHSSLKVKDSNQLERVQKSATKLIMGKKYDNYNDALKYLNLEKLSERRKKLCLKFAKKCVKHEKTKQLFPLNNSKKKLRNTELFKVNFGNTDRYKKSTIPFLQNLLNKDEERKRSLIKACGLA